MAHYSSRRISLANLVTSARSDVQPNVRRGSGRPSLRLRLPYAWTLALSEYAPMSGWDVTCLRMVVAQFQSQCGDASEATCPQKTSPLPTRFAIKVSGCCTRSFADCFMTVLQGPKEFLRSTRGSKGTRSDYASQWSSSVVVHLMRSKSVVQIFAHSRSN